MAESWREKQQREARTLHAAVDVLLADRLHGDALRARLAALQELPYFRDSWPRWVRLVWDEARATPGKGGFFTTFLHSHLSTFAIDPKGDHYVPWTRHGPELEALQQLADEADDVALFRHLLRCRLSPDWQKRSEIFCGLLTTRLARTQGRSAQLALLDRFSIDEQLDEPSALRLHERLGALALPFIERHLPWGHGLWEALHAALLARGDEEAAYRLWRRQVEPKRWAVAVRALLKTPPRRPLIEELERLHPDHTFDAGPVFLELAKTKGEEVLPYLLRHVRSVSAQYRFAQREAAAGLMELLALSESKGWHLLWARLLQSAPTAKLWNQAIERLLKGEGALKPEVRERLVLLAGTVREWNFGGFGLAFVQPLEDEVACLLHTRAPALLGGVFLQHLHVRHDQRYPKLIARLQAQRDEPTLDFVAARAALDHGWGQKESESPWAPLAAHYEALPVEDGTFARRAVSVLSRMPAFAIWSVEALLRRNALARLLFSRSTEAYLAAPELVSELLESPQIHVQTLAFRILGSRDPRAPALAAAQLDGLLPTLLRKLHRRSRLMAFAALRNAALHDEAAARRLIPRIHDAFALPERRYPKEALVELLGAVLHRWPALRLGSEQPTVFRKGAA